MIRAVLACAFLVSSSLRAEAPPERQVLVLDFDARGVPAEVAQTLGSTVAVRVGSHDGLRAVSGTELRRMADLEAEKVQLGCAEDAACLAELAGALGADLVVFGEVGRVGALTIVTVGMFDPARAAVLARETVRDASVDALPGKLDGRVDAMLATAGLIAPPSPGLGVGWLPWSLAGGAAVVTLLSGGLVAIGVQPILAYNEAAPRVENATSPAEADAALADVDRARRDNETWGIPSLVAGGVGVFAGVVVAAAGLGWGLATLGTEE